ncbi:hypothetical protein J1605_008727 [Eschrichtius robustus]|uniref:Uncharacterized protein n=1 Tax=Eschrichtius robustus TaxID=9764 RepID=A0AB34GW25_ESCRO|nr:hypothetical protein J1605_008727 [Eschrichtius robustus]
MQREEGFNTKMADGPDEYETEAGCVPLLHPEGAVACVFGVVERAEVGEGGEANPGPSAAVSG